MPARLCPADVRQAAAKLPARLSDGKGAWIVVSGFRREDLGAMIDQVPSPGTTMRFRFRGQVVSIDAR